MVTPHPSRPSDAEVLDAIIIGGGPAGLSAALVLGRCLRRVLVCDAGHPRNEPARIFNGFLSRDGSTPAEFLQICRDQLRRYETIEFRKVKVVDVEREDCRFTAILETGERVAGRMLLLATGLVDELPQIENFRQFYGSTVHNCPYCDGWECRNQPIAVIGGNQDSVDLAIELLLWSKDLVLCTNGLSRVIAKRSKLLGDWTFGSLRPLSPGWRAMVTSSKESGLPTATSSREQRSFSHRGSTSARIWRNNLAANFARIPIVFSAGKTPRRTSPASMPLGMPAVACSSSLRLRPKVCRRPSRSIAPSSMRMLRVTHYAITSPANPRLRIALSRATRPLTKWSCERLAT
jgi:hypothetical protein